MPEPGAETGGDLTVPLRLQRYLARAGVASRRGSEALMTAGRVRVNGAVVRELGTRVDPLRDVVTVDGRPVAPARGAAHIMLNKPAGVLTTMSDPRGRPCVAPLVPRERFPGLFPVGRLDKDTTGLLLFSTDGLLAQRLLHPSGHVWKTYRALVEGPLSDGELEPLRRGMELDDGPALPARARLLPDAEAAALAPGGVPAGARAVEVRVREGRKRQVRRMLAGVGHPVLALHRARFGPLELGGLAPGAWRELAPAEVADLERATKDPEREDKR